jgi:long-chain acyl-CoA synthetase
MFDIPPVNRLSSVSASLSLGRSLPSLLDQGCDRHPNVQALNQWQNRRWRSLSNADFRTVSEELALGLLDLGLQQGDRVAFVMHSDLSFCKADMGCLLAGLVDVPIDLTQTIENILFVLQHCEAKVLIVSNLDLLYQLLPYFIPAGALQMVVVAEEPEDWEGVRDRMVRSRGGKGDGKRLQACSGEECLQIPHWLGEPHHPESIDALPSLPESVQLMSLDEVRKRGSKLWSGERVQQLRAAIAPHDLATILYIASETKRPKGVMLSHENISADILAAFDSFPNLKQGADEVALLFLPLTHIFARAFLYGHLAYGHSVYFSDPNHLIRHIKTVNPTVLITVPRLLEKLYERILDQGQRLGKFDQKVFHWALKLARRYEIGRPLNQLFKLQLKLADRLVFAKWRSIFGDRMKAVISGGAALPAQLANVFTAAGIPVLQGYGLTETSAVLCYNRGVMNRAGTVGVPIPGVELAIAPDQEILVKSPFVMQGYYRDSEATQHIIDADGWLHTGDLGELSADGFLTITGVKKALFKLATGKYVSPLPLEQALNQSPLVKQAIAVGANHKFCGMLIFPDLEALRAIAPEQGIDAIDEGWLHHPCILALCQALIDDANCHLPYWSTVRKFKLMEATLTVENGLLQPDGTFNRVKVLQTFAADINSLYTTDPATPSPPFPSPPSPSSSQTLACPNIPPSSCPIYAKSLTHY